MIRAALLGFLLLLLACARGVVSPRAAETDQCAEPPVPEHAQVERPSIDPTRGPAAVVMSTDCEGRQLEVFDLPAIRYSGTPIFNEPVGDRLALITVLRCEVLGSILDPLAQTIAAVPRGGPKLKQPITADPATGRPWRIGTHVLFSAAAGFSGTMVFDPAANRWLDASDGAPRIQAPSELLAAPGWWAWLPHQDGRVDFSQGQLLDLRTGRWRPVSSKDAPTPRSASAVTICGDVLFVWGGSSAAGEELDDGAVLRLSAQEWSAIPSSGAPSGRYGAFAGCADDSVVVFGGNQARDSGKGWREAVPQSDGAVFDLERHTWRRLPALKASKAFIETWSGRWDTYLAGHHLVVGGHAAQQWEGAVVDLRTGRSRQLPDSKVSGSVPPVKTGVTELSWVGLREGSGRLSPGALGPMSLEGIAPQPSYRPTLAVFDALTGRTCTWALPSLEPFALPGAVPMRFGPFVPGTAALAVLGSSGPLPPEHPCPPGAPCLPSTPRFASSSRGAILHWR